MEKVFDAMTRWCFGKERETREREEVMSIKHVNKARKGRGERELCVAERGSRGK
jgi:hypothetical protein